MAQFETLTAVAAPIVNDDVDTDQIFPARFSSKDRKDGQFGSYFLHDQRFDENGGKRAGFILNDPRVTGAEIIVAAANYACGSARPGAIYSHVDAGIKAVIAEGFGSVFAGVAYKSGLLTIQVSKQEARLLREQLLQHLGAKLTIDLNSKLITAPDGTQIRFELDDFVKTMFIKGLSEIDLTLGFETRIKAFEARQRTLLPWVYQQGGSNNSASK